VNEISDRAVMTALGKQMTAAVSRQAAAATNLANLDTPGYRTKDVTFDTMLDARLSEASALTSTDPRHLTGTPVAAASTQREVDGLQMRRDGNNVQLDRELLNMQNAATDFGAAQAVLAAKFRLVRYAINDGK